jgi:hypothetical protein
MESLIEWLPQATEKSAFKNLSSLIHGDIRVDNAIFDSQTPSVSAILGISCSWFMAYLSLTLFVMNTIIFSYIFVHSHA